MMNGKRRTTVGSSSLCGFLGAACAVATFSFAFCGAAAAENQCQEGQTSIVMSEGADDEAIRARLSEKSNLESLTLPRSKASPKLLASLRQLEKLKRLAFPKTKFSPDHIVAIAALEQLEHLDLRETNVDHEMLLANIGKLRKLKSLNLSNTRVMWPVLPEIPLPM
jgi:hypothetical protein